MTEPILRLAVREDIPKIKSFINTNWKRYNLINNEALFQFYFVSGDQVNFVLAEDEAGTLYGTLAFIYCGYAKHPDIGATLFKTIRSPYTLLGIRMYDALKALTGYRTCFSQNMVPNTATLHRMMGHTVCEFEHWYRLSDRSEYHIARVKDKRILPACEGCMELILFPEASSLFLKFTPPCDLIPYKDAAYIRRRYYEYPAYRYNVYGVRDRKSGHIGSILVCREVEAAGERMLKIVDFIGDAYAFSQLSNELQRLMDQNGYEYIEMYQYGLAAQTMKSAGFVRRTTDDPNVIATWLEPLAQVNTEYMLYYTDHMDRIRLFRADCDMDRPNLEE